MSEHKDRETKRQGRLRRRLEKLGQDEAFMKRVKGLREVRRNEEALMGYRDSDRDVFILAQEYNFPYTHNGPLVQLIDKGAVTDYSDFDAIRLEFMYPRHLQDYEENIYTRAFNEAYPIRIEVAADASLNEIKDSLSAHRSIIEAWQRFMYAKHDIITRNNTWNKDIHDTVVDFIKANPGIKNKEVADMINEKFEGIVTEDNISKIKQRFNQSNKPRRSITDTT